jgi:predicted DCC family thiol-disulfide oxidoreductase YuxK
MIHIKDRLMQYEALIHQSRSRKTADTFILKRMVKHSAASAALNMILASADVMIWTVMNMLRNVRNILRRMIHDYILVRTYTWNHSRSGWYCMRSDHVR